jgi:peptidoglycan-associated lipoprotein
MSKTRIYLSVIMAAVIAGCGNRLLREADLHYSHYEFATAAQQYENFLKNESDTAAMLRLADCYRQMNRHKEAVNWYAKSISSTKATAEDQLHYAQELRSTGDNKLAEYWFDSYVKANPTDTVARMQRSACSVSEVNDVFYDVEVAPIVTNSSCFSPFIYNGKVYFSMEAPKQPGVAVNPWTGHGFLDLYSADPSNLDVSMPLDSGINSMLHESNIVFTADGKTAYFTRSSMKEIKSRRKTSYEPSSASDHDNHIEICSAQLADGKWTNVTVLSFNNQDYSCGHPALTANGQRMYFTSDMPGGRGGTDIYYSDLINGQWSAPANAGVAINTSANEMFPAIFNHEGSEDLYFSSNGWMGYGGLDIYRSSLVFGLPYTIKHLPAPFNSRGDDFGITFAADMNSGFFSSNRDNETGDDRIFRFARKSPLYFLNLTVLDKETRLPVANTEVEITNTRTNYTWKVNTDSAGRLIYASDSLTTYGFKLMCNFYFCGFNRASVGGFRGKFMDTTYATIDLEKIVINKPIRLENIYYDYNKWNIRTDAAVELDKLVKIMQDNPKIKIELSSHTDSRGSDKYNMTLSQKRAQSAVDYIVSKGVSKDRIYAKGYGESKPLNRCTNGVKCSEEEFQWNRRTEFKVVEIAQ